MAVEKRQPRIVRHEIHSRGAATVYADHILHQSSERLVPHLRDLESVAMQMEGWIIQHRTAIAGVALGLIGIFLPGVLILVGPTQTLIDAELW